MYTLLSCVCRLSVASSFLYFLPSPPTPLHVAPSSPSSSSSSTFPPRLHHPSSPQEEESPEGGELKRTESSPTPLKRDRSFSEHDLALLRGEMLPSLSESAQLDGAVRLRGERARSRTLTSGGPPPYYRGQYVNVGFR